MSQSEITRHHTVQRMSRIVIHQGTVYLCGQVGLDFSAGIKQQTQETLDKIDGLLAEAGTSKQRILSATVYVKDMADFKDMNEVWDAWTIEGSAPARACVQAEMARPKILVEISIIAAL